jgi:hypothetical protein
VRVHRRLKTRLAVTSLLVLGASSLAGCSADDPEPSTPASEGPRAVTLRVTGTGWPSADVSVTADDKASPIETKSLPWSKELRYDSAATLWLFATYTYIPGRNSLGATLTCEVIVDGTSVSTFTGRSRPSDDGSAVVEENAVCSYTPGE